jgi:hypothetical protein
VVIGFLLIVVAGAVFYLAVWKVPDCQKETEALFISVENRIAAQSAAPADKNAWTYYKEAADSLDLSKVATLLDTGTDPQSNLSQYINQYSDIRKIIEKGVKKEKLPLINDLMKANQKAFEKADRAFAQDFFYHDLPNIQSTVTPGKVPDDLRIMGLGYLLILSGELDRAIGNNLGAARRYMQAVHLDYGYKGNWTGFMGGLPDSYGHKGMDRLKSLLCTPGVKKDVADLVAKSVGKFQPQPMDEELAFQLYRMEKMLDQLKGNPQMGSMAFLMDRERYVMRGEYLDLLSLYARDPAKFPTAAAGRKPAKFSVYGNILTAGIGGFAKGVYNKIASYGQICLGAALARYRADNGSFPAGLDELTPRYLEKLPPDPYAPGGKFSYRREKNGYVLYSLGPDGIDGKGKGDDLLMEFPFKTPALTPPAKQAAPPPGGGPRKPTQEKEKTP